MQSNEYWIADTHTFDVVTKGDGGGTHRLYLTAFMDARSGIFSGLPCGRHQQQPKMC